MINPLKLIKMFFRPRIPDSLRGNGIVSDYLWDLQQKELEGILSSYEWEVSPPQERPIFSVYICTLKPSNVQIHYTTLGAGLVFCLPDGSSTNELALALENVSKPSVNGKEEG